MWLHRHVHGLITFAGRTYYRVTVAGESVPPKGPVLLVANHPNSLMDPALVALAADRPVRFLARAPLFEQGTIGWLVRGSGAIPVYRRMDDPELVARNEEMFSAVHEALAQGAAVGIFPEGISHSGPSLAPLKTGAARIALGASRRLGATIPILPMGITFRGGKERIRSEALILVGRPVRWEDLFEPGVPSLDVVRALTQRVHADLSRVTVNLSSWEDFPLVEGAEAIHEAELGREGRELPAANPVRWLVRMQRTAAALETARQNPREEWEPLARDIVRHMRVMHVLGLKPADLHSVPRLAVALRWTLTNLFFFGLGLPLSLLGTIIFFPPAQVISRAEARLDVPSDRRATYKLLGGTAAFGGWVLIVAAVLRELLGWQPAIWALVLLPPLGFLTLRIRDRWRDAVADLSRFLLLRGRTDLRGRLLERQAQIADRIRRLQARTEAPR